MNSEVCKLDLHSLKYLNLQKYPDRRGNKPPPRAHLKPAGYFFECADYPEVRGEASILID